MNILRIVLAFLLFGAAPVLWAKGTINRGLTALTHDSGGVYLSWRQLASDPPDIAFDVYRFVDGASQKLNPAPITRTTDFIDAGGSLEAGDDWYVAVAGAGQASRLALKPVNPAAGYLEFSTGRTSHGRSFAVGDLKGRGQLDFILRLSAFTADPYYRLWSKSHSKYTLTAFDQEGVTHWTYDMGHAIEMGMWYSPYVVYDLDGDGKAELIVKAGDETIPLEDMRDESGRIMYGPEYLRVISGEDGRTVLAQADWPDRTGFGGADAPGTPLADRKYEDYNRWSRNFIAIAYLDGVNPHVVVNRGTYGKHKTAAYRYADGQLTRVWYWENKSPGDGGDRALWGQGAHSLQAHDVTGDGKDEVVLGGLILGSDGVPLWSLARGHVDHVYIGNFNPARAGKELYYGSEQGHKSKGIGMVDAATGELLWGVDWPTSHIHREGMCADIDPESPGTECYSGESNRSGQWTFSATGDVLSAQDLGGLRPFSAFWDGNPQKEIFAVSGSAGDGILRYVTRYPDMNQGTALAVPKDIPATDLAYLQPLAVLDLFGDWREELVVADRHRILVYMSTISAQTRHPWLMEDHSYRMGVASASLGYYQQPMLSYDMANSERIPSFGTPAAGSSSSSASSTSSSSSNSSASSSSSTSSSSSSSSTSSSSSSSSAGSSSSSSSSSSSPGGATAGSDMTGSDAPSEGVTASALQEEGKGGSLGAQHLLLMLLFLMARHRRAVWRGCALSMGALARENERSAFCGF